MAQKIDYTTVHVCPLQSPVLMPIQLLSAVLLHVRVSTHVVHYGWTDYCSIQIQANMAHVSGLGHTADQLVDMSNRNLALLQRKPTLL